MDVTWPVKNLSHRQMIVIPLIIAAIFASAIVVRGGPPLTMDFSGGVLMSIREIDNVPSVAEVEEVLQENLGKEVKVHKTDGGLDIEISLPPEAVSENMIKDILSSEFGIQGEYSIPKEMGSIITDRYKGEAINAVIGAVIAMAVVLFIAIRHFTTVGGILTVIGLDLLGILGGMTILGIPLGLASMAGILLLLGYGVNTNILLTDHVLRRVGGTPRDRAADAMGTGVIMSTTSASAMLALNIITTSPALYQLSAVMVIGILVDMMNTWLLNAGLVTHHAERMGAEYRGRI